MLFLALTTLDTDDRDRVEHLYEKYRVLLMRCALHIVHVNDLAEEALQNTFLSAINHKEKILHMTDEDFSRWSVIVIKRKCFDLLRIKKRQSSELSLDTQVAEIASGAESIENYSIRQENFEILKKNLMKLSIEDRWLLQEKYICGKKINEIAVDSDMTPNQINGKISRARAKLRKLMESEDSND